MSFPTFASFEAFYRSELQSVYALLPVPLLLLGWLLTSPVARARASEGPADARFVHFYTLCFACETILDPLATGPLARWLGYEGTALATAVLLLFVLLGDFRVFLLVFRLARPEPGLGSSLALAALATLFVPLIAWPSDVGLRTVFPDLPHQSIWLIYELAFFGVAVFLREVYVPAQVRLSEGEKAPRASYLRSVMAYVAVYYALWALADVLILVGRLDAGWGLRVIPNQLYYALYLPFVYFRFFSRR
jgi:hypothetical protein